MEPTGEKRGPFGRPLKKGNASWAPRQRLDVRGKADGFRYRWAHDERAEDKMEEGWAFVNKSTGIPGEHIFPEDVQDNHPMTSAKRCRELVLMALPEDMGKARDAYYEDMTQRQTIDLKENARRNLAQALPKAQIAGRIIIE